MSKAKDKETESFQIRLPVTLAVALQDWAHAEWRTRASLIRQLLVEAVKIHQRDKK